MSHLVHQETTFDHDVVRRHITVLALTSSRLVIAHADDHADERTGHEEVATATTESVPLSAVRGVMLTHVVPKPQDYRPRLARPRDHADPGLGGRQPHRPAAGHLRGPELRGRPRLRGQQSSSDDISLRISADAEGEAALQQALGFAQELSASIGR